MNRGATSIRSPMSTTGFRAKFHDVQFFRSTVFDTHQGAFSTSTKPGATASGGFVVVQGAPSMASTRALRWPVGLGVTTIAQSVHRIPISRLSAGVTWFFCRRVGDAWVYDVNPIEVRTHSNGDITIHGVLEADGLYLGAVV